MWETLLSWTAWALTRVKVKPTWPTRLMKLLFWLAAGGALIYILADGIITLGINPTATSTSVGAGLTPGFSLAICWSKHTSDFNLGNKTLIDVAQSGSFWNEGNNLSRKIAELRVRQADDKWILLWDQKHPRCPCRYVSNKELDSRQWAGGLLPYN